jgi:RNA polymerase sigma-70 factor, ECF subfamily
LTDLHPDIITKSKSGDLNAFTTLVEKTQQYAYALALRMLCHHEDANDVVQESFIRVWKHLPKYKSKIKFTTWLYKIVTNLCLDQLKSRKRRGRIFVEEEKIHQIAQENECPFERSEAILQIERLSEQLTPKQKTVFVLRDLQDLEMDEIAKITGFTKNVIKSNLYLARMNIRNKLRKIK